MFVSLRARQRAFTLIELLVVILVVAVLLAVAAPSFLGQQSKAHDSAAKQTVAVAYRSGKALFTSNQGAYPALGTPADTAAQQTLFGLLADAEPQLTFDLGVSADDNRQVQTGRPAANTAVYAAASKSGRVFCVQSIEYGTRNGHGPGVYWSSGTGELACGDPDSDGAGPDTAGQGGADGDPLPDPPVIENPPGGPPPAALSIASVLPDGSLTGSNSWSPSVSDDGQQVAFDSRGAFAPFSTASTDDVLRKTLASGAVDWISQASGAAMSAGSEEAQMTPDGRYVAFLSADSALVPGDNNAAGLDVFRRDTLTGLTVRVSVNDAGQGANAAASLPSISDDGRYVAFRSAASNLTAEATGGEQHAYVRDIIAGVTVLADRADGAAGAVNNRWAGLPVLSGDGRHLLFYGHGSNLHPDQSMAGGSGQFFLRDLDTHTNTMVSRTGLAGMPCNGLGNSGFLATTAEPALTYDASHVAFSSSCRWSTGTGNSYGQAWVRTVATGAMVIASRADGPAGALTGNPSVGAIDISDDGNYVAFTTSYSLMSGDGGSTPDHYFRDIQEGRTVVLSKRPDVAAYGTSWSWNEPSLSSDGKWAAFATDAQLVDADTNTRADVYVYGPLH